MKHKRSKTDLPARSTTDERASGETEDRASVPGNAIDADEQQKLDEPVDPTAPGEQSSTNAQPSAVEAPETSPNSVASGATAELQPITEEMLEEAFQNGPSNDTLRQHCEKLESQVREFQKHSAKWAENVSIIRHGYEILERRAASLERERDWYKKQTANLERERNTLAQRVTELESKRESLEHALSQIEREREESGRKAADPGRNREFNEETQVNLELANARLSAHNKELAKKLDELTQAMQAMQAQAAARHVASAPELAGSEEDTTGSPSSPHATQGAKIAEDKQKEPDANEPKNSSDATTTPAIAPASTAASDSKAPADGATSGLTASPSPKTANDRKSSGGASKRARKHSAKAESRTPSHKGSESTPPDAAADAPKDNIDPDALPEDKIHGAIEDTSFFDAIPDEPTPSFHMPSSFFDKR